MIGQFICNDCNYQFEEEMDMNKQSLHFIDKHGIPFHGGPPLFCPNCNNKYMTWLNYKTDFERKNATS